MGRNPKDPCPLCSQGKPNHPECARCHIMIGPTHMEPLGYIYEVRGRYYGKVVCKYCLDQLRDGEEEYKETEVIE